ncbi:adenylate/guanylate cyclase domain-containing protein [Sphingomonas sp. LB-2]|uniref:CHASE2 domain-containing protein n=1 Tax=Sphingomonas caeni TaxID=2984949 RepID=UPI00222F84A8|nr:adenylate/guanylate cyclase domain-containing protein [Sphingomonas caeni]MCW3849452.1 adenylate/guanylate cyclase domain-containing protein [Sphingomonas caeni]
MRDFWIRFGRKLVLAVPGLLAVALVLVLNLTGIGGLDRAGMLLFDTYNRIAPREYKDAGVRVVDIDEESLRKLGQWPWPRSDMAALTQKLVDAGAAVVAYDIVFAEPDRTSPARLVERAKREKADPAAIRALEALPDNDAIFADTLSRNPVVLGFFLGQGPKSETVEPKVGPAWGGTEPKSLMLNFTSATQPIKPLRDAAPGLGAVSRIGDDDGIVRQAPMVMMQNGTFLFSLVIESLRVGQHQQSTMIKTDNASGEFGEGNSIASLKTGDVVVPTDADGQVYVYYTRDEPSRVVPAWKILTGAIPPEKLAEMFDQTIVYVGTGAPGLQDLVSTPLKKREPGVMVHAQATEQVLLGQFLQRPYWANTIERGSLMVLGVLMALLLPWMGATRGAVLGVLMVGGMALGSWMAFRQQMLLLDPTYPILGLILAWVSVTVFTYYREERQRAYIHQAFDRYLSPDLVKRIVDDPSRLQLGGEEREMTVLFCDIRGFSRISEKLDPQEIIRFLIAFLTPMCDILLARKATIDKFIGDAILAFWNAPLDDPDQYGNAARGALAMVERLKQLNKEMPGGAEPWPGDVGIGIGLNSGPCCVGNMGSAQRLSYSLIGDTVNLASRIEGLTKYYGVTIAMGEDLQARLREFATIELDRVRVVGRDAPETVHALVGDEALAGSEAFRAFAAEHDAVLLAYRAQAWDEAAALLAKGEAAAKGYGLGKLYALMGERVARYRDNPPGADWDGVYGATEK